jgi:hypothetical protein
VKIEIKGSGGRLTTSIRKMPNPDKAFFITVTKIRFFHTGLENLTEEGRRRRRNSKQLTVNNFEISEIISHPACQE